MIKLSLSVFEDRISADIVTDYELTAGWAPESLIAWWQTALDRLQAHDSLKQPYLNEDIVASGLAEDTTTIEVMLATRAGIDALSDCPGALGVFLISTQDSDPFNDESAYARAYRILVASDPADFMESVTALAEGDIHPRRHLDEYLSAYLVTMFHEIAHAVLFAANAGLIPPADVDTLSDMGEIAADIFSCKTGYTLRPLEIDGEQITSRSFEEAVAHMEDYVEQQGKMMLNRVLTDIIAVHTFPAALGVEVDFEAMLDRLDAHDD
ncbi:hypothetical protein ACOI1H_21635 [Loktanella sp. DJP18]|uniref:hypothetical protein n=1 Tax=Loktanella sp. DJP18 TaxID=3409788 RepID=UPI003BB54A37